MAITRLLKKNRSDLSTPLRSNLPPLVSEVKNDLEANHTFPKTVTIPEKKTVLCCFSYFTKTTKPIPTKAEELEKLDLDLQNLENELEDVIKFADSFPSNINNYGAILLTFLNGMYLAINNTQGTSTTFNTVVNSLNVLGAAVIGIGNKFLKDKRDNAVEAITLSEEARQVIRL